MYVRPFGVTKLRVKLKKVLKSTYSKEALDYRKDER